MIRRRANSGWHIIDNKMIYTDSDMEARLITRLAKNGFSLKWRRTRYGIAFGTSNYTPDVELCVMHAGESIRALVEFKAFTAGEFTLKDRKRMISAAYYYKRAIPLLYVDHKKQWYFIDKDASLVKIDEPKPGFLNITQLYKPRLSLPIFNYYGRGYVVSPLNLLARKTADALEFGVNIAFSPRGRTRRRK